MLYLTLFIRLGNGEVAKAQACAAACVDPKTFDATLSIVESALCTAPSTPRRNRTNITYQTLLRQYVTREDAFVPMVEVENALKDCGEPVAGSPVDLGSALMQCAIFFWVCNNILRVSLHCVQRSLLLTLYHRPPSPMLHTFSRF